MSVAGGKLRWGGEVLSVQPRIRLLQSFDERSHSYLGYVLRLRGRLDGVAREFSVAVGKAAQARHGFRAGPTRKVPGRRGMIWEEEDWVDEQDTVHRGPNE